MAKPTDDQQDRLPWFVYAIPIVLVALLVAYAVVASWIPGT